MVNPNKQMISRAVLRWYDAHARDLPWRTGPKARAAGEKPDPYHVWLSEIMLQQTTVATVKVRYGEFLQRWPKISDLAASPVEDILNAWAGLGYYARARNLHKCARFIVDDHGGQFPQDISTLKSLPGIGDYTANAIAAIAFDRPSVVMDGNIERITARLFAVEAALPAAKTQLRKHVENYWPTKRHGDFAQGLMDIGSEICRPKNPYCDQCPIQKSCVAFTNGTQENYPVKVRKSAKPTRYGSVFVMQQTDGAVAFNRRPDKGLLGGMLGLPGSDWSEGGKVKLSKTALMKNAPFTGAWQYKGEATHIFTHFHLVLGVYHIKVKSHAHGNYEWQQPDKVRLPTVMKKAMRVGIS